MNLSRLNARINKYLSNRAFYKKTYKSYQEAAKKSTKNLYENTLISATVKDKAENLKNAIHADTSVHINVGLLSIVDALYRVNRSQPEKTLKVIDFGGGEGSYYLFARKLLPQDIPLQWYVVETGEMARSLQEYNTAELHFVNSIGKASIQLGQDIDVVFTSGTIQYTEFPFKVVQELVNIGGSFLILNRQSLSLESFDIISVQTSMLSWHGYGPASSSFKEKIIKYPHTSIRQDELEKMISSRYKIQYTFPDPSGIVQVNKYRIIGTSYFCIKKE